MHVPVFHFLRQIVYCVGQYVGTYAAVEEYKTDEWLIHWSARRGNGGFENSHETAFVMIRAPKSLMDG